MPINVNRTEVLSLMQDLPADHFLQSRLVDELIVLNKQTDAKYGVHSKTITAPVLEVKSAVSHLGTPEVINGKLVVTGGLGHSREYDGSMGQYTTKQLDEIAEVGGMTRQCKWETYGYQCAEMSPNEFCIEHDKVKCSHLDEHGTRCFNMANHGCPTELQFVCGAPCCSTHQSCGNHYRRR